MLQSFVIINQISIKQIVFKSLLNSILNRRNWRQILNSIWNWIQSPSGYIDVFKRTVVRFFSLLVASRLEYWTYRFHFDSFVQNQFCLWIVCHCRKWKHWFDGLRTAIEAISNHLTGNFQLYQCVYVRNPFCLSCMWTISWNGHRKCRYPNNFQLSI